MKITAVHVEMPAAEMTAPFVIASSLANAAYCDAGLPWRPGGYARDLSIELRAELRDGASTVIVPGAPGMGITPDEDAVVTSRAVRRW